MIQGIMNTDEPSIEKNLSQISSNGEIQINNLAHSKLDEMSDDIEDDDYLEGSDEESDEEDDIDEYTENVDEDLENDNMPDEDEQERLNWLREQWNKHTEEWYKVDEAYWEQKSAVNDEMTGGDEYIHKCDIKESLEFIQLMKNNEPQLELDRSNFRALDVGSGIGRVTQNVLLPHAHWIDLLERNQIFLDTAKRNLGAQNQFSHDGVFYQCELHRFPLEDFCEKHPILKNRIEPFYDVIWMQWFTMYLTDDDFVDLLMKLSKLLKPKGVIIVKESISDELEIDKVDRSITRTVQMFEDIFSRVPHLYIVHSCPQREFPEDYLGIHFWALKHKDTYQD